MIPNEKDWQALGDANELDANHAYRMFNGKSHEQAVEMFNKMPFFYQEDVMWMPLPCFKFYVRAYIQYLLSDKSIDDPDSSNSFIGIVGFRLNEIRHLDEKLKNEIFSTVQFIADNQLRFDADEEIYGSFQLYADRIFRKLSEA